MSRSFSQHFSSIEVKFSWCALPRLVKMPMVGLMMRCNASISFGSEMAASKIPTWLFSQSPHTERGTPICEL